jgi:hypothetical protein
MEAVRRRQRTACIPRVEVGENDMRPKAGLQRPEPARSSNDLHFQLFRVLLRGGVCSTMSLKMTLRDATPQAQSLVHLGFVRAVLQFF